MNKFNYIMKLGLFIKSTQCLIDSEFVVLDETEGDYSSQLSLLNKVEELRKGMSIDKYEIKAMPISIKNNTDFMFIHPSNSNYKWYMSHSKTSDEAIMSLSNKVRK